MHGDRVQETPRLGYRDQNLLSPLADLVVYSRSIRHLSASMRTLVDNWHIPVGLHEHRIARHRYNAHRWSRSGRWLPPIPPPYIPLQSSDQRWPLPYPECLSSHWFHPPDLHTCTGRRRSTYGHPRTKSPEY